MPRKPLRLRVGRLEEPEVRRAPAIEDDPQPEQIQAAPHGYQSDERQRRGLENSSDQQISCGWFRESAFCGQDPRAAPRTLLSE